MSKQALKVRKSILLTPSTAPTDPSNGEIYYDTALDKFQVYQDGAWSDMGGGGASDTFTVIAGENLLANEAVYISKGTGDGGRTLGQAYKLDPTDANRMNFVGFVQVGVLSGATATIQRSGIMSGFVGFTAGEPVYGSIAAPGGTQIVAPNTGGQWIVKLGTARAFGEILIDGNGGLNAIYVGDDTEGTFDMTNNQSSAADITNLAFSGGIARGAVIHYTIYRYHTGPVAELVATGTIRIGYRTAAGTWNLNWDWDGDNPGVTFSITNAGQIQYVSTNLSGTQQSFVMKWNYWVLPV